MSVYTDLSGGPLTRILENIQPNPKDQRMLLLDTLDTMVLLSSQLAALRSGSLDLLTIKSIVVHLKGLFDVNFGNDVDPDFVGLQDTKIRILALLGHLSSITITSSPKED